jgi:hypothetical protein
MNPLFLLVLCFCVLMAMLWWLFPSWFKRLLLGRKKPRGDAGGGAEDEDSSGVVEDTVKVPWTELLPHVKLEEYLRIEGATPEGYSFWLIVQPCADHALVLTACDFTGTIQRTSAGERGLAVIRPGQCMILSSELDHQDQLKQRISVGDADTGWPAGVACAVALTNGVNYCEGNELVCRARTQRLSCKFVKAWDLPTEYALRSAQSVISNFAMHLVEAKSLSSAAPEPLASDKVYVLGDSWGNAMDFKMDDKHGLRVFRSYNSKEPGGHTPKDIERDLKHQDLVHLRLAIKTSEEPGEGQDGDPIVLYREVEDAGILSQNLARVNVVVGVKNSDGTTTDCLRIQQVEGPTPGEARHSIKVEFLAGGKGYGAAVWKQTIQETVALDISTPLPVAVH